MLLRSLKLNHGRLVPLVSFAVLTHCGTDQFSATGGVAGKAGGGGMADTAGAAGEADAGSPSGGASGGGTAGMNGGGAAGAGAGGKPSTSCNCPATGSYCQDGTKTCRSCADFSSLEFSAPERLAALTQSQTSNERFPRPASAGSDLFYRAGADASPTVWYSAAPVSGTGRPLLASTGADSGPLYAPKFSAPQNFFFDRVDVATGQRQIMAGTWLEAVLSNVLVAPAPLNAAGGDFSVAIAADVRRAYWMSGRFKKAMPDLIWATFGSSATEPAPLGLEVQAGAGTCPRSGDDATPWVNAAGTLLLFRNPSVNDRCEPSDSGAYDLYAAPLAKDGTPLQPGVALSALNTTGGVRSESDPSLSVDLCTIYFASDNGKGNFDLYRASRK